MFLTFRLSILEANDWFRLLFSSEMCELSFILTYFQFFPWNRTGILMYVFSDNHSLLLASLLLLLILAESKGILCFTVLFYCPLLSLYCGFIFLYIYVVLNSLFSFISHFWADLDYTSDSMIGLSDIQDPMVYKFNFHMHLSALISCKHAQSSKLSKKIEM